MPRRESEKLKTINGRVSDQSVYDVITRRAKKLALKPAHHTFLDGVL